MKNLYICQSCSMPMKEEKDFGSNSNKEKNKNYEYCIHCYKNGKFTKEKLTMEEQINKNIQFGIKMGMDEKTAKELEENTIPKLKRWKKL